MYQEFPSTSSGRDRIKVEPEKYLPEFCFETCSLAAKLKDRFQSRSCVSGESSESISELRNVAALVGAPSKQTISRTSLLRYAVYDGHPGAAASFAPLDPERGK